MKTTEATHLSGPTIVLVLSIVLCVLSFWQITIVTIGTMFGNLASAHALEQEAEARRAADKQKWNDFLAGLHKSTPTATPTPTAHKTIDGSPAWTSSDEDCPDGFWDDVNCI